MENIIFQGATRTSQNDALWSFLSTHPHSKEQTAFQLEGALL
jgi:hypothetical protein